MMLLFCFDAKLLYVIGTSKMKYEKYAKLHNKQEVEKRK